MSITINFYKTGLLITSTLLILALTCNKNSTTPCVFGGYSFNATSEWRPQKEIYNVGDTIFLSSTFPKMLTDLVNPSLTIDYSNSVGIGGNLTIYRLDTVLHEVSDAALEFNFYATVGKLFSSDTKQSRIKDIYYDELTSEYSFKVNVVSKQKGLFAIFISNLLSRGLRGKNCTNAGFSNTLTNTNKNLNLFQYAMGRLLASQFEVDRIYCFRVQ